MLLLSSSSVDAGDVGRGVLSRWVVLAVGGLGRWRKTRGKKMSVRVPMNWEKWVVRLCRSWKTFFRAG